MLVSVGVSTRLLGWCRSESRPARLAGRAGRATAARPRASINFRPAQDKDGELIRKTIWGLRMNPLGLNLRNFSVAETDSGVVGFAQLKPLTASSVELASLVILEKHRYCGVGTRLALHVLEQARGRSVYLTTLQRTTPFFKGLNFREIGLTEGPWPLVLTALAGTVVARAAAQDRLVVMKRLGKEDSIRS